jgi:hypothetical protein
LDTLNKVALIAHEAFYSFLRGWATEENSIRTRRAIGYVMSGKSFVHTPVVFPEKNYIECHSQDQSFRWNAIYMAWTSDDHSPKSGRLSVYPKALYGSYLIGVSGPVAQFFDIPSDESSIIESFKTGKCRGDIAASFGVRFDSSPVEFDRQAVFSYDCPEGIPQLTMREYHVGQQGIGEVPLICKYVGTKKE